MTEHLDGTRERRASLRTAIGRVERAVASPAGGRASTWSAELAAELEVLGQALQTHVAVNEAPGGLFDDIVEHAPHLAHRVVRAKRDHAQLQGLCEAARATVPCDADGVAAARERTVELLLALVRHRHDGSELVFDAFNVDLEAAD